MGARVDAAKVVMPMAVSPDKRFLIAAVRSKPYEAYTYAIDKKSGALKLVLAMRLAAASTTRSARGRTAVPRTRTST